MAQIESAAPLAPARPSFWRALRQTLAQRVGYWRSMLELTLAGVVIFAFGYLPESLLPSHWAEVISFASIGLYIYAAWRLAPGDGAWWWRFGRTTSWLLLFSLLNSLIGWGLLKLIPYRRALLGMRIEELNFNLSTYLVAGLLVFASLFGPTRVLIDLWDAGRKRLRWQFTFAFLLLGVLTNLFVPLAVVLYIGILSLTEAPPVLPPTNFARTLSSNLAALLDQPNAIQIDAVLQAALEGHLRVPALSSGELPLPSSPRSSAIRRLSLLHPEGAVIASVGRDPLPVAQPLPPALRTQMDLLLSTAAYREECVDARPADGVIADTTACAVRGNDGALLGIVLVETSIDSATQVGAAFGRIVEVTLLGSSLTLNVAVFVVLALLPVALFTGYGLARRLTRRLERLASATGDIAAGNLTRRVDIDTGDEIGQLSADFNRMALQLEEREHALAQAAARAENLLKANKRLIADVSHELRNPLATLRGYIEVLEANHRAELPSHDLAVIYREMDRLTGLIDDLFTVARAEAQQLPLKIEPVDIGAITRNLAETLMPLARREREVEIVVDLPADLPWASADQARIEQVLRNLAQNALRYTPPGGIIVFTGSREGDLVTIAVIDTGIGIDPSELPHVFERFYRSDASRARETGGSGLGLALVKELVEAMGGSVHAESSVGRGSRFGITLRQA